MTLDQLRYFQAVCKYDGVSRAAEILNLSQPSVSNAIANLEKEFGVTLFTRQRKRLFLTDEGKVMYEMAEKLLQQANEASRTMQELGRDNKVLRIGVPPMVGSLVLPVLFKEHFNLYPQLQVRIVEDDNSGLRRLLADNQVDMAFLPHMHPFGSGLCAEFLAELQNVCYVNKSHHLATRKSIRLSELNEEPLVLFKNSFFQTEWILSEFKRLSIQPSVVLDTAQLSTLKNMITCNAAIGFMFEFLGKSSPELVGLPLDPPMMTRISLVWNENCHLNNDMKNLIHFMKNMTNKIFAIS